MSFSSTPEFINNKLDVWSLGCILYELLTGERAFSNDRRVLAYASGDSKLSFTSSNPRSLDNRAHCALTQICHAMLRVNADKRPIAKDILRAISLNMSWEKSLVWVSECCHYPHTFIDLFAAPRVHSIWKAVMWLPGRDNISIISN